jgi:hypothetical protein
VRPKNVKAARPENMAVSKTTFVLKVESRPIPPTIARNAGPAQHKRAIKDRKKSLILM